MKEQNYEEFYKKEIAYRNLLAYPPMGHLLGVLLLAKDREQISMAAKLLGGAAKEVLEPDMALIGPTNATIWKMNDCYRKVMYVKAKDREQLVKMKDFLEGYTKFSQYFRQIKVYYDMDPMNGY